ncbi:MAG: hypothetical protein K0R57_2768 [Paenibacillaceae bacterium]|jgi:hypothetical protein|nr:hypothetical protein [Paenibacillaceae bacterium]
MNSRLCLRRIVLFSLILSAGLCAAASHTHAVQDELAGYNAGRKPSRDAVENLELSVRSSEDAALQTTLQIQSTQWSSWLDNLKPAPSGLPAIPYTQLELSAGPAAARTSYRYNGNGILTARTGSMGEPVAYSMPDGMARALQAASSQLSRTHYGRSVAWAEADKLVPKGMIATITDLETGLAFRGQRRAGSSHADVQPLTKEDTAVMKQIYGGEWSWNRRAVLVSTEKGMIGASMHGMPHGGDGIPDNDFSGHFCIHYKGSITHGSGHTDPAHQAMIHKACGELEAYHQRLTPVEVADLFLIASNQKDKHILQVLLQNGSPEQTLLTGEWLDASLKSSRRIGKAPDGGSPGSSVLDTVLRTRVVLWRTGARPQAVTLCWNMSRSSAAGPWQITNIRPEAAIR